MKIGIYCGSFSPVHKGHIKIVKEILKSKLVDKVLLIPTKAYWDKKISISLKHRTNMLKLYENKKIIVEEKLSNTKCTYEVFTKAEKKYKNDELYLIVGADNLPEFEKWIEYKKLLEYKRFIGSGSTCKCYTDGQLVYKIYTDSNRRKVLFESQV